MQDIINFVKDQTFIVKVIIFLGLFVLHSFFAVLLNKQNNAKYGKTTILAWIPVFNIFLLGKLAIHFLIGLLLVIGLFFGVCITFNINGLESIHNCLPSDYVVPYQIAYGVILLLLCIIVRIKYNKALRNGSAKDTMTAFIHKDYGDKEPEIKVDTKPTVTETIKDNFQYNHHSNKDDNQNP